VLWESAVSVSTQPSTYGSGCTSGGTCGTYNCVACPNGHCFCGLDASNSPTCFQDGLCQITCTTNGDCGAGQGCVIDSCCGLGGYCILLTKDPTWCNNAGKIKRDYGLGWVIYSDTACGKVESII
jgi:hypothetical protein